MSDVFDQPDGAATPLEDEEKQGLKLSSIAYRHELNAAEQENILLGQDWALRQRARTLLSEAFIRDLHRHMFGDVWEWAGKFRKSAKNIGIDHWEIPVALRHLVDDATTWIEANAYPPDEIAVRFHHRLVQIHPFANGNGRHARMMADLLLRQLGKPLLSWGRGSLRDPGQLRKEYIAALRAADKHDIHPLLAFARS